MKQHRHFTFKLLLILTCLISGCASVKPWQKGNLAKSYMGFDPDALEVRQKQHIYFSKEGSSGGYGIGGGGCGCN